MERCSRRKQQILSKVSRGKESFVPLRLLRYSLMRSYEIEGFSGKRKSKKEKLFLKEREEKRERKREEKK